MSSFVSYCIYFFSEDHRFGLRSGPTFVSPLNPGRQTKRGADLYEEEEEEEEAGQAGVNSSSLLSPLDDISIVSASMKLIFLILVSRSGGICTH